MCGQLHLFLICAKSYFSPRWKVADRDKTAVTYGFSLIGFFQPESGGTSIVRNYEGNPTLPRSVDGALNLYCGLLKCEMLDLAIW